MRFFFPNATRPKRAAKHIAHVLGVRLAQAQRGVACACGYRDWHELEGALGGSPSSTLDQELSHDEFVQRHSKLSLGLAKTLGVQDGDAQYALSGSRLTGDRQPCLAVQIAIRLGCFRATSMPPASRRMPGAVGVLKSPGLDGEVVILRDFGAGTTVMSHGSSSMLVADFEYVTPKTVPALFLPMRLYMPYGFWTENDGADVVFSRDYKPLWRIRPDRSIERVEPWLWISFQPGKQTYFWQDGSEPWKNPDMAAWLESWLAERGILGLPILADALPIMIQNRGTSMSNSVKLLKEARSAVTAIAVHAAPKASP